MTRRTKIWVVVFLVALVGLPASVLGLVVNGPASWRIASVIGNAVALGAALVVLVEESGR